VLLDNFGELATNIDFLAKARALLERG